MKERSRGKKAELTSEEVRAAIVRAAKREFAQHGFQGASLKEMATQANVAASLINYHFKDKSGLFKVCLEGFMRDRMAAIQRILGPAQNVQEFKVRLHLFVEEMMAGIITYPDEFEIIDREMKSQNEHIMTLFEETMLVAFKQVVGFFGEAQSEGLLDPDLDPMLMASVLFTSTCDIARKEVMAKRFFNQSFTNLEWRKKVADHIVHIILKGVAK